MHKDELMKLSREAHKRAKSDSKAAGLFYECKKHQIPLMMIDDVLGCPDCALEQIARNIAAFNARISELMPDWKKS